MSGKAGAKRLSPIEVISLRERAARGEKVTELAAAFGVTPDTVYRLRRGASHTRIGGPRTRRVLQEVAS